MFISEMMRGMRESMLSDDEQDSGLGSATMTDTFDTEFGRSMSGAGGLGLARVMLEAFVGRGGSLTASLTRPSADAALPTAGSTPAASVSPRVAAAPASVASAYAASAAGGAVVPERPSRIHVHDGDADGEGGAATTVRRQAVGTNAPVRALPGPVTSGFGWRHDPFTGKSTFHAGTDIRLAYGQDVASVAAGRVTSVGDRSGYGLTVVIDHGQGLETRYAHLSSTSVKVGEVVESGQVVARSGNSGRSTGPHLHLEARRHGRAVEMAALLKSPGMSADSYADDRSSVRSGHED